MSTPASRTPAVGLDRWLRTHPVVPDLLLALVLAGLTVSSSIPLLWDSQLANPIKVGITALIVVGYATVAVRRIWPEAVYAVVTVEMAVLLVTPDLTGAAAETFGISVPAIVLPSSLVYLVAMYSVAAGGRGRTPIYALVVGLIGAALTAVRLWQPALWAGQGLSLGSGWRIFLPLAALCAVIAPWSLGRFRRVRAAYVAELETRAEREERDRHERAEQAAARERNRIAREMHDVVAHSLSVMVAQAEGARLLMNRDPDRALPALQTIATTGRDALSEMRGLLGVLRSAGADGAEPLTPQPGLDQLPALVDRVREAGLPVTLEHNGTPAPLGPSVQLAVYRMVQEALTNVVKHAGPDATASVTLTWSDRELLVAVLNSGTVVEAGEGGQGLIGMRERISQVEGHFTAESLPDGFSVQAHIPLRSGAGVQ